MTTRRITVLTAGMLATLCTDSVAASSGNATYTTLDVPGARSTTAYAIDGDHMVGHYVSDAGAHYGFLYDGTDYTTLDAPQANQTFAYGIDGNNIVGKFNAEDATGLYGFVYDITSEGYTILNVGYVGHDGGNTRACGIDGNKVVGWFEEWDNIVHGFMYDIVTETYTTLDVPGAEWTHARDVDGGNVVGYFVDDSGGYGFLYDGTTYTTLDVPGGAATNAFGIDGDSVVGWFYDEDDDIHGYLYDIPAGAYSILDMPGVDWTLPQGIDGDNLVGHVYDAEGIHGFLRTTIPVITGDMNSDGFVGADDLSILILNWNEFVEQGDIAHGDITGDGYVGADDLAWMIDNWNAGTLPAMVNTVPEPSVMALLSLLLVRGRGRRRR